MAANAEAVFTISANVNGQAALEKFNKTLGETGQKATVSAGQTRAAFQQLPAQFTDIVTQLAGGQNPFLILIQQGGQIKDSFGGVGNTMRAFASVLTPIRLAMGGVATVVGALAIAAYQGADAFSKLQKSIALTGGFSGQSFGSFSAMAGNLQASAGGSIGNAKDVVSGAIGTGQFSAANIEASSAAMIKMQKLSGQTADEVVKDFASMGNGVANWAARHNESLHYLSVEEFNHIRNVEMMGDKEKAWQLNVEALTKSLDGRKVQLGYIESALQSASEWWSKFWNAAKGLGVPETVESQLEAAKKVVADMQRIAGAHSWDKTSPEAQARIEAAQARVRELQTLVNKAAETRNRASAEAAKTAQAIKDIQDGTAFALASGKLAERIQLLQNQADQEISGYEIQQARLEATFKSGLITEKEYNDQKVALQIGILGVRRKLYEEELNLEQGRATNGRVDIQNQKTRIEQIKGLIANIDTQTSLASIGGTVAPADGLKDKLKALNEQLAQMKFNNQHIEMFGDKITAANEAAAKFDVEQGKWKDSAPALRAELLKTAKALDDETNANTRLKASIDYTKQTKALELETSMLGQTNLQRQVSVALQDLENAGIKQGTDLYTQLAERRINALTKANDAQKDFNLGMKQGFQDYMETVANVAASSRNLIVDAFKGMEDALVNFCMTGKFNFRDMANSIIQDMIRIQIRQGVTGPLASIFSSFIGSFAPGGGTTTGDFARMDRRAAGGTLTIGRPTLVGENGPEIIMPGSSGTVIPNHQIGGMGNNINIGITVNADGSTSSKGDSVGVAAALGQRMAAAARAVIVQEQRPGGLLYG